MTRSSPPDRTPRTRTRAGPSPEVIVKLAGVSLKTMRDIEQGRSEGTIQTLNRILGVVGLRLGVVRADRSDDS